MQVRIGSKAQRRAHIARMICYALVLYKNKTIDLYTLVETTMKYSRSFAPSYKVKEGEVESMIILLLGLLPGGA